MTISFQSMATGLESGDYVRFQISYNGGSNWNTVWEQYGNHVWTQRNYDLSTFSSGQSNDNSNFMIRFRIYGNDNNDLTYIDNIVVNACDMPPSTTLFNDEFSSTNPLDAGWSGEYPESPSSTDIYSDIYTNDASSYSYDGYYMVTKDDAAAVRSISTVGFENIKLSYYRRTAYAESGDRMVVEWRVGTSGSWTEIERTSPSNTWTENIYSFPNSANDEAEIQIRFWLDDGNSDYALWDNIVVIGYNL